MYLKSVSLENIRCFSKFEMSFREGEEAGWHVLIGDNGSGKSSIIKATALGLLGEDDAKALELATKFSSWITQGKSECIIKLVLSRDNNYDMPVYNGKTTSNVTISKNNEKLKIVGKLNVTNALWGQHAGKGWFFMAYGASRKLKGDTSILSELSDSRPRLIACITAFNDGVALPKLVSWLKDLGLDARRKKDAQQKLNAIVRFINESKLLPNDSTITNKIDSDGIWLKNVDSSEVSISEVSDGYRTVLSFTLDIIRYLIDVYGIKKVFPEDGTITINLPGVILIDEIDAHLHPTWQTRIGSWFRKYFPNIQFIVTTHSPLICRGCETGGTIWRLPTPGTGEREREIMGVEKDRLVYGNILEATSTNVFGGYGRTALAEKMVARLAELNVKSITGILSPEEEEEHHNLQLKVSTRK